MTEQPQSRNRSRLEDLSLEEAVGGIAPPDLTARILAAAQQEEAPTPVRGTPVVAAGRAARPTRGISRRHWAGLRFVAAFVVVFAAGLVALLALRDPPPAPASTAHGNSSPGAGEGKDSRSAGEHAPVPAFPGPNVPAQSPGPLQPPQAPEPVSPPQGPGPSAPPPPQPSLPPETVEEPTPPTPEPPHEDPPKAPVVEEPPPKPEPEPTEAPDPWKAVAARLPAGRVVSGVVSVTYEVEGRRVAPPGGADSALLLSGARIEATDSFVLALEGGASVQAEGPLALECDAAGVVLEPLAGQLFADTLGSACSVRLRAFGSTLVLAGGALLADRGRNSLEFRVLEGEAECAGKRIAAGKGSSLSKRGLGAVGEPARGLRDSRLLRELQPVTLWRQGFDAEPLAGLQGAKVQSRSAAEMGERVAGSVAMAEGADASVGMVLEGFHSTLSHEVIRVRFRQRGAGSLTLQCFNPDRNDNFGRDLPAGKPGEWQVLELPLTDLRDRETGKVPATAGLRLSSISLFALGANTTLEVDWFELVRKPRYDK